MNPKFKIGQYIQDKFNTFSPKTKHIIGITPDKYIVLDVRDNFSGKMKLSISYIDTTYELDPVRNSKLGKALL